MQNGCRLKIHNVLKGSCFSCSDIYIHTHTFVFGVYLRHNQALWWLCVCMLDNSLCTFLAPTHTTFVPTSGHLPLPCAWIQVFMQRLILYVLYKVFFWLEIERKLFTFPTDETINHQWIQLQANNTLWAMFLCVHCTLQFSHNVPQYEWKIFG